MKRLIFTCLASIPLLTYAQAPNANFIVNTTEACVGEMVTLTSTSTAGSGSLTAFIWSAPGGQPESQNSAATSFSTSYNAPGTYNLSLIVQSSDGLSDGEIKFAILTIHPNPVAAITANITNCSLPISVQYGIGGSTTGPSMTYNWSFNGASPNTGSGSSPLASYAAAGTYTANLTVTNTTTKCSTPASYSITLEDYKADFSAPVTACVGEMVTLMDQSLVGTNQWSWTFENGTILNSISQNPSLAFAVAGTQQISLTATNTLSGCSHTVSKTITILPLPNPSFSMSMKQGCAKDSIIFTNTNPTAGATFSWNFGDGSSAFQGTTPPLHDYVNNGTYYPILTMTGSNGCVNYFRDTLNFFEPNAHFSLDQATGCAPQQVSFTDLSDAPRPITNWYWDFGDGSTSTQQSPQHTFACGVYDVQLVIRIAGGCVDTISLKKAPGLDILGDGLTTLLDDDPSNAYLDDVIRYGDRLDVDFTFDKRIICAWNEPVKMSSLTPIDCQNPLNDITYNWIYNGSPDGPQPDSSYSKIFGDTLLNGPIAVELEIDFNGCKSTKDSSDLFYLKAPVAGIQATKTLFCNEGSVQQVLFDDALSVYGHKSSFTFLGETIPDQANDDVEVSYDFGDGSQVVTITDDTQLEDNDKGSISHTYSGYGTYTMTQRIDNHSTQCYSEKTVTVTISHLSASWLVDTTCIFGDINYDVSASTYQDHPISAYTYYLYDDTISSSSPIYSHPHNAAGIFDEFVRVSNAGGCSVDVLSKTVVFAKPLADIKLLSDSVCPGTSTQFDPSNSQFGGFQGGWDHFDWTFQDGSTLVTNNFNPLTSVPVDLGDSTKIWLQVTDGFGCVSTLDSVTIHVQKPVASFNLATLVCDGVPGVVDASLTTGNGPLTYIWKLDGVVINTSNQATVPYQFNVTPATNTSQTFTYELIVLDNKNCSDTLSKTITVKNPIITSVVTTKEGSSVDDQGNFTCPPVVVDFDISTNSEDPIVSYEWSLGNDLDTDIDSENEDPKGIQYHFAGSYAYNVTVYDANGCPATFEESPFLVIGGPSATPIIILDPNDICGRTYLFEVTDTLGLTNWSWNVGDGTIITSADFPAGQFSHQYTDNIDYFTTLTVSDTTPPPGCSVPYYDKLVLPDNGLNAFFTADPLVVTAGSSVHFVDGSTSTNPIVEWVWNYGDGFADTLATGISVDHSYYDAGNLTVELTIKDENGCIDKHRLVIVSEINFVVPNVITAIGSGGVNSTWTLFADIFIDFEILIVNRWGNVVYEGAKNHQQPRYLWDGIDYVSGKPCQDGVYFWVIKGDLKNGNSIKEHGYLTLLGKNATH